MDLTARLDDVAAGDRKAADVLARARDYRRRHIDPVAAELDRRLLVDPEHHAGDLVRAGCAYRFLGLLVPEFLGGGGALSLHSGLLLEELSAGCAGVANLFGAHYLGLSAILLGLDLHHFDTRLVEVVEAERRGEPVLYGLAVTEPTAGTDVEDAGLLARARLVTRADRAPGGYLLNGRKVFISNGSAADRMIVICALDRSRPVETWTSFVVPRATAGFSVGRVERKMGQRACHAAELVFEDCFVPESCRLGLEGRSMDMTDVVLGASRAPVAAIATGIARGALERTHAFVRRQPRLARRPWVQAALADMLVRVEQARAGWLEAASLFDRTVGAAVLGDPRLTGAFLRATGPLRRSRLGLRVTASEGFRRRLGDALGRRIAPAVRLRALGTSSAAKASASDLAIEVCLRGLEVLGAAGCEEREGVEKCLRDAKLTQIYEGTNQLNRHAVYRGLVAEAHTEATDA